MTRRVAGAPISWGVCEVPDWGHQMTPDRVLEEMTSLGLVATELGPDGFLPDDPTELREMLAAHSLSLVAGFVPVVLHDPARWAGERAMAESRFATLSAGGAEMAVLAAATGADGYEESTRLTDSQWEHLVGALLELEALAALQGLTVSVHPHYGTMIEDEASIHRFLAETATGMCLDTGHVLVGGGDPVAVAERAGPRITHVHLKDVDTAMAAGVRAGETSYYEAVRHGMYRPLGAGDVDVAAILDLLDAAGYGGWLVLEQDLVLEEEPPPGSGPIEEVGSSLRFLEEPPDGDFEGSPDA